MVRIICKNCKKQFVIYTCRIKTGKKFCSMKCYVPFRAEIVKKAGKGTRFPKGHIPVGHFHPEIMCRGEKHPLWKGDKVGYRGLHYWIIRQKKGRAMKCSLCGKTGGGKKIQWANKDGKYRRKATDYFALCASCHKKHDIKLKKGRKNS